MMTKCLELLWDQCRKMGDAGGEQPGSPTGSAECGVTVLPPQPLGEQDQSRPAHELDLCNMSQLSIGDLCQRAVLHAVLAPAWGRPHCHMGPSQLSS